MTLPLRCSIAFLSAALIAPLASADVAVKQLDGKVRVDIDGQLFTEYCYTGAPHVYFWPLIGPGGARMTRDWPMKDTPGEDHDHPHHRSLWFAHGEVNGIDFWAEAASTGGKPPKIPLGTIVHDKFLKVEGGAKEGVISSQNKWVGPDGVPVLTSVQTFRVYQRPANEREFDFEVTLTALEMDVTFQDSKEGAMAIRINESMRIVQPGKKPGAGHMLNSEGDKDTDVWGKRAKWIDCVGPVEGKTLGIAIFDHPGNPKHPTRWHARDYGLFAVNPFCEKAMEKSAADHAGDVKIPAGKSVTYRYRFYIHEGDTEQAKVADRYSDYTAKVKTGESTGLPPATVATPSATDYKPEQSPIEILKEQGPNVSAWVSSTLDTPIPEVIWENLTFLKESLRDEAAQKPKASTAAYGFALRLCAMMIDDLAERKVALTKAGGDAVLRQNSQLTESRRDHLTWPMYALERDERGDRKQWAKEHNKELVDWAKRTNDMRYDLGVWYNKFREALRQSPAAK
jgi:hypothetical protein